MSVSGNLIDVSVAQVMQFIHLGLRTGTLVVSSSGLEGRIGFHRGKIISADGEFQAAAKLAEASSIIERQPIAVQLRFLQALTEVAGQNNSTTVFPVPVDLLSGFMGRLMASRCRSAKGAKCSRFTVQGHG